MSLHLLLMADLLSLYLGGGVWVIVRFGCGQCLRVRPCRSRLDGWHGCWPPEGSTAAQPNTSGCW